MFSVPLWPISKVYSIELFMKFIREKITRSFNFTFRYIDDVFSLNNSRLGDFVDSIDPYELEIKDVIDTTRSASYLDLHLEIDIILCIISLKITLFCLYFICEERENFLRGHRRGVAIPNLNWKHKIRARGLGPQPW